MNRSKIGLAKPRLGVLFASSSPDGTSWEASYAGYGEKTFALAEEVENPGWVARAYAEPVTKPGQLACPDGYRYPGEGTRRN